MKRLKRLDIVEESLWLPTEDANKLGRIADFVYVQIDEHWR